MIHFIDKIDAFVVALFAALLPAILRLKDNMSLSAHVALHAVRYLFSPSHVLRPVRPQSFSDLDIRFYDITRNWLLAKNFLLLEDVENITVWLATRSVRTFLRVMRSADGQITATFFHAKWTRFAAFLPWFGFLPRTMKCLSLDTEFSDGTFLCTTNAKEFVPAHRLETVARTAVPSSTSLEEMLRLHCDQVRQYTAARPGIAPLRMVTLANVLVSQERLRKMKNLEDSLQVDLEKDEKKQKQLAAILKRIRTVIPAE